MLCSLENVSRCGCMTANVSNCFWLCRSKRCARCSQRTNATNGVKGTRAPARIQPVAGHDTATKARRKRRRRLCAWARSLCVTSRNPAHACDQNLFTRHGCRTRKRAHTHTHTTHPGAECASVCSVSRWLTATVYKNPKNICLNVRTNDTTHTRARNFVAQMCVRAQALQALQ